MKAINNPIPQDASVLFATFSMWTDGKRMPTNGSIEPLRDFLVPRIKKLVIIDQLVPGSEDVMPKIEEYKNHDLHFTEHRLSGWMYWLKPWLQKYNRHGTRVIFKIRDFLSVIDYALNDGTCFDYFVGLESINGLAGIVLRRLGRVKKVVYYVSDYAPNRFSTKWFNLVYLALDRICAQHTNFIWDVSKAMHPARIKAGLDPQKSAKELHVPNGLFPDQIIHTIPTKEPFSLAFMGTLGEENGPDLALECLQVVLKKYPMTTLHIVGGGEKNLNRLKDLVKRLGISKSVKFYGFVVTSGEMTKIISKCIVGLAPYRAIPGSIRYYGDATKIRTYAAAGLPVITSEVPPLGKELVESGGAIMALDNKDEFSSAIIQVFQDKDLYLNLRRNALNFAKTNTWNHEFEKTFSQMTS